MFGVLQIIFSRYTVTAGLRVTRQGLIFFENLPCITAHAQVDAIAVECLVPERRCRTRAVVAHCGVATVVIAIAPVVPPATSTAAAMMPAMATTAVMTSTRTPTIVVRSTLSHASILFFVTFTFLSQAASSCLGLCQIALPLLQSL
jgi:hypothetical protein